VKGAVFRDIAGDPQPLQIALGWHRDAQCAARDRFLEVARDVLRESGKDGNES